MLLMLLMFLRTKSRRERMIATIRQLDANCRKMRSVTIHLFLISPSPIFLLGSPSPIFFLSILSFFPSLRRPLRRRVPLCLFLQIPRNKKASKIELEGHSFRWPLHFSALLSRRKTHGLHVPYDLRARFATVIAVKLSIHFAIQIAAVS